MATVTVEQFRAIPIELSWAFELTLPMPLTAVFSQRYGLLPRVKEVRGHEGAWGQVGRDAYRRNDGWRNDARTPDSKSMLRIRSAID